MASAGNDLSNGYLGNTRPAASAAARAAISAVNYAKFQSIQTMKTALTNAGYSAAQLNVMTRNDMVFALRRLNSLA